MLRFVVIVSIFVAETFGNHSVPRQHTPGEGEWKTLRCSAIGELVAANANQFPKDFAQWKQLMSDHGDGRTQEVFIPLSRSINPGSLARPRGLISSFPNGGSFLSNSQGTLAGGKLALAGRLFIAKSHPKLSGPPEPVLEFISWNKQRQAFDFGIIEDFETPQRKVRIENPLSNRCVSCHKNEGPIFTINPWSDTAANPSLYKAMIESAAKGSIPEPARKQALELVEKRIADHARRSDGALIEPGALLRGKGPNGQGAATHEGIRLLQDVTISEVFDESVGLGATLEALTRWLKGQSESHRATFIQSWITALVRGSVLSPKDGSSQAALQKVSSALAVTTEPKMQRLFADRPFRMLDFDPARGGIRVMRDEPLPAKTYAEFDKDRQSGKARIPDQFRPTSLTAFLPETDKQVEILFRVMTKLGVEGLSRVMGVAVQDLKAIGGDLTSDQLEEALKSPEIQSLTTGGKLPSGELLKERWAQATEKATGRKVTANRHPASCAEAPGSSSSGPPPATAKTDPSYLCMRCHTVGNEIGPAFGFDPTDQTSWRTRLDEADRTGNRRERQRLLRFAARILERLETQTMPPDAPDRAEFASDLSSLQRFLRGLAVGGA